MRRIRTAAILALTALALTLASGTAHAAGVTHTDPYSYTQDVQTPAHGYSGDLVTFRGQMCRGRTAYASVLAVTDAGGEESEPGTVRPGHISFRLLFGRGDGGRWVIVAVSVTCADGSSGQYAGGHPVIYVDRSCPTASGHGRVPAGQLYRDDSGTWRCPAPGGQLVFLGT